MQHTNLVLDYNTNEVEMLSFRLVSDTHLVSTLSLAENGNSLHKGALKCD